MRLLMLVAVSAIAVNAAGSSFTAGNATIPASLKYILDQRIGTTEYELLTFDLEAIHDSVENNLPDAQLVLSIGAKTWNLVLNEYEIRADASSIGDIYTFKGNVMGDINKQVRLFVSPVLIRGTIYSGTHRFRIIPIAEYGSEFNSLSEVYVYTSSEEEIYQHEPEGGDCELPFVQVGVDSDYAFYVANNSDASLVSARIWSALFELEDIYWTHFNVLLRFEGPYIRTEEDNIPSGISQIRDHLSQVWLNNRPCVEIDVIMLFSGESTGGGGHAVGQGCFDHVSQDFPTGLIDWQSQLVFTGGTIPGWFNALVHEMGHLLGSDEEEKYGNCASQCNSPNCNPPVMCQTGCNTPESFSAFHFSSCSRTAIQNTLNAKCTSCFSEPSPPPACPRCYQTYSIRSSKSIPLISDCETHNEIEITFSFGNHCDPEEIEFGFTFNPLIVEITDLGDFDQIIHPSPFPLNPASDFLVTDPYAFDGEEGKTFSFKARLIGEQENGETRFTLVKDGLVITPGYPYEAWIDVPYTTPRKVDGTKDLSTILDVFQADQPYIYSTNRDGCIEDNPPVEIDGTLNIDVDFCLKGSYVIMKPEAKIIIEEDVNLVLDSDNIFGCDELWDHIYLEEGASLEVWNCTIEDAEYAIHVFGDDADVYVRNTDFNNNYVSIYAPFGHTGRSVSVSHGVDFNQTRPLKSESPSYQDALAGIVLNDVQGALIIGGLFYQSPFYPPLESPLSNSNLITFSNLKNGILLNHSDVVVRGTSFTDIANYGISSVSDGTNILWLHGGIWKENYFNNCFVGVNAENTMLNVKHSTFQDVKNGIWVRPFGNYDVDISHNLINARARGIQIGYPFEIDGKIESNHITVTQPGGVGIEGIFCNGDLDILSNRVNISGGRAGISLLRSQRVEVTAKNEVMIFHTDDNEPRGIEVKDSPECNVSCNIVMADDIEAETWGLHVQDSPDMIFSCNKTSNLTHNFQFFGLCTNTDYRGSSIGTGYAGLELGSAAAGSEAIIGVQEHRGNKWQTSYEWKGAWHYSSEPLTIQASRFISRASTSVNPPNVTELINLGWFVNTNSGPSTFECSPTDCEVDLIRTHEENIDLLDSIEFAEHSGVKNWLKERQIFRRLERGLVNPASHVDLASFYSARGSTIVGEQVLLDHRLRDAFHITGQDSTDRSGYLSDRSFFMDSLLVLGSMLVEADSLESVAIRADVRDVVLDMETLHAADAGWAASYTSDLSSLLTAIEYDNQQLTVKETCEEHDQTVNSILLASIDNGTLNISPTDSATLYDVASLCAFEFGPGVYHARALYALIDTLVFDDYDTCGTVSPRSFSAPKEVRDQIEIGPNPANDFVTIYIKGSLLPDQIHIVTGTGSIVLTLQCSGRRNTYNIGELHPGLYYLMATKKDGSLFDVSKLVIIE